MHKLIIAGVIAGCSSHPTPAHHPSTHHNPAMTRCLTETAQQQLSADLCEGLPHPNWTGWHRLSAAVIRDTFPPNEHHKECWFWVDDTSITVCTDGAVMGS